MRTRTAGIRWNLVSDPDHLRKDRPTVHVMAAEELILDRKFEFIDSALDSDALFEMILDKYYEHPSR